MAGSRGGKGGQADQLPGLYFPLAVAVVAAGGAVTAALRASKVTVGYVIYGLMAVAFLIVPNVLAFWYARRCPSRRCSGRSATSIRGGARP